MRYHMHSAGDFEKMTIRRFYIQIVNFKKTHANEMKRQLELHGFKQK